MTKAKPTGGSPARLRCAIYTRKSNEEGLEQSFNSLHAQREACEAYILSQVGEGWGMIPTAYDDGGFSGGNMDRPAVTTLLADVDAGLIDIIVVYKVDRLTRSLMDFARIVERLDARSVSFVSVTQAFNTTSSMGRLTLNVLLSFAQFEREVTGERIRDKIAASKAKGMWMGGAPPLGYDIHERKLVINPTEAECVRQMFSRYATLGSVPALLLELEAAGTRSKRWVSRSGRELGGIRIRTGALYYLLQNRIYVGEIVHKDQVHPGEHEAIVDRPLFDAVQAMLASHRRERRGRPTRAGRCPLAGLIFDADGVPMSPSFGYGRGKVIYRYYVSASVLPGRGVQPGRADAIRRVPAAAIESLVLDTLSGLLGRQQLLGWEEIAKLLLRVELHPSGIHLVVSADHLLEPHEAVPRAVARLQDRAGPSITVVLHGERAVRLICDGKPQFRGDKTLQRTGEGGVTRAQPIPNRALIKGLKAAHDLSKQYRLSPLAPEDHKLGSAPIGRRERRLLAMALLAPDIQRAIMEGRAPAGLTMQTVLATDLPIAWSEQRRMLAISS